MHTKPWAKREQYAEQIQELRQQLLDHKQQTINVTKARHEYENFIMDQSKRKHQIVKMTDTKGKIQHGNNATTATAQQWKLKFTSKHPGPLGYTGTTKHNITKEQETEYIKAITETALTEKHRKDIVITLTDLVTENDITQALRSTNNNKQAGVDEEMIQFSFADDNRL